MTDAKKTALQWRRMLPLLVGGVVLSMALVSAGSYLLPQSAVRVIVSSALLAIGLFTTGWLFWRHTRELAGDQRRADIVAVLAFAFLMPHEREWIALLGLGGGLDSWQTYLARFLLTCVAIGIAMLVYKRLQPIDAREALENAKTDRGASS